MKKLLLPLLAVMVFQFSCSEVNESMRSFSVDGERALINLQLDFPGTYAPETATASESAVNSLHVFIFNSSTGFLSDYASLTRDDFTWSGNSGTLKSAIETSGGLKKIGIGINLPPSFVREITEVQRNIRALGSGTVYDVSSSMLATADNFVMFSTTLPEQEIYAESTGLSNSVSVDVGRLVGKAILVEHPLFSYSPDVSGLGDFGMVHYKLMQTNLKSYLMKNPDGRDPNYLASDFIVSGTPKGNQYDGSVFEKRTDYLAINSPDADYSACPAFYGAENTSDYYQKGTTTYFMVKSRFTPKKFTDGNGSEIHPSYTPGTDFWTVSGSGRTLICISASDAEALASRSGIFPGGATIVRHVEGYCYWAAFNGAFVRNTFYIGLLRAIKSFGAGDEGSVIPDPEAPSDGGNASVEVNLSVLGWEFDVSDEVDLE